MNVTCPQCETTYRVDPRKVPAGGVRARCAQCSHVFPVHVGDAAAEAEQAPSAAAAAPASPSEEAAPGPETAPEPAAAAPPAAPPAEPSPAAAAEAPEPPAAPAAPAASSPELSPPAPRRGPAFGAADPHAKAKRLARALISDIVVYHPERRDQSLAAGTLRQEFRDEIQKSWDEYVGQVGSAFARETPYFREALNEILANGARMF